MTPRKYLRQAICVNDSVKVEESALRDKNCLLGPFHTRQLVSDTGGGH